MQQDDSTDIRLPDHDFSPMKDQQRQFHIKSNTGKKIITSYRQNNRRNAAQREHSAVVAIRRSKDRERRNVLAQAY